jgi:hypothetical protein
MLRRHAEIWIALALVALVTGAYGVAFAFDGTFPLASGLVGHGIGVLGFLLMLATQTLYSIRKQATTAAWGPASRWLQAHIVTGLVGPYMVLLHTAMAFRGLAGIAMLMTVVVVASGIVGRYLYTTVDRTPGDADPTQNAARHSALATSYAFHVPLTWLLFALAFVHVVAALAFATLQRG